MNFRALTFFGLALPKAVVEYKIGPRPRCTYRAARRNSARFMGRFMRRFR